MTQVILYTSERGSSVVKHCLTTAADGQRCRGAQYRPLAIGPLPILYTACRERPMPDQRGNCQGMLDGSSRKVWAEKRWGKLS